MIKRILTCVMFLSLVSNACAASKESHVKKGNAFYKKGDFESSVKSYENALKSETESAVINFNLGTALYKNKNYSDAIDFLQKGLLSDDLSLKKNAHFNLGDAFYAHGLRIENTQIDEAVAALEESFRQFTEVVNLDDKDKDAQYNRDIVQKKLQELKKKKQQQEQKNQQGQGKDQKEQTDPQKEGQDPEQKSQDSSSQEDHLGEHQNKDGAGQSEDQKPPQGFSQDQKKKQNGGKDNEERRPQSKPGEMTKEEANALLRQFEQSPESTGLLNFDKRKTQEIPVLKDW